MNRNNKCSVQKIVNKCIVAQGMLHPAHPLPDEPAHDLCDPGPLLERAAVEDWNATSLNLHFMRDAPRRRRRCPALHATRTPIP